MGPCASKPPDPAHDFMRAVVVRNYGVLGKRMAGGGEEAAAPAPDKHTMIVDPCSARFVRTQGCAIADAGGASGAIYEFIGYRDDAGFPADVVNGIEREGDVFYHKYGWPNSKHVIHCVGYDFRTYAKRELGDLALSPEIARDLLAKLCERLLMETAKSGPSTLRLVPVSAGIFAGPLLGDMPAITAEALSTHRPRAWRRRRWSGRRGDAAADYAARDRVGCASASSATSRATRPRGRPRCRSASRRTDARAVKPS
ncbi:hypothetical protein JL721_9798 [Aureococcus anophagefferens]|nr:hypothetical protein JL721_9798 [Aureococcus anophagefferens]